MKIRLSIAAFLCSLVMGVQGAAAATVLVVDVRIRQRRRLQRSYADLHAISAATVTAAAPSGDRSRSARGHTPRTSSSPS